MGNQMGELTDPDQQNIFLKNLCQRPISTVYSPAHLAFTLKKLGSVWKTT